MRVVLTRFRLLSIHIRGALILIPSPWGSSLTPELTLAGLRGPLRMHTGLHPFVFSSFIHYFSDYGVVSDQRSQWHDLRHFPLIPYIPPNKPHRPGLSTAARRFGGSKNKNGVRGCLEGVLNGCSRADSSVLSTLLITMLSIERPLSTPHTCQIVPWTSVSRILKCVTTY